jgi:hypothetical protein
MNLGDGRHREPARGTVSQLLQGLTNREFISAGLFGVFSFTPVFSLK